MTPYLILWAGVAGYCFGPLIGWAIRSWPGHEELIDTYLMCPTCGGGMKRACCNAGGKQDKIYSLFSALVAAMTLYLYGFGTKAFFGWLFSVSCLIIAIVDIRYLIIPDILSINGCILGLLYSLILTLLNKVGFPLPEFYIHFYDSLLGFFIGGGFLWGLGYISILLLKKEGMGGGDVKLLAAFGAWMGWKPVIGTIVIASLLGSIGGITGIIYNRIRYSKKYKPLTHMIPFGPYLCIGFLLIFYGGLEPLFKLMEWYQIWFDAHFLHHR